MKTYNFGLIGCGRISSRHLQAIDAHPQAHLTHVCDVNLNRAKTAANGSKEVAVSMDLDSLLQDPSVNVISICTPSGTHAEIAERALLAGKHVIIEKPLSLCKSDAQRVIAAQKKSGCVALPVMQNRFNPAVQRVVEHREAFGPLHQMCANVFWYRPQSYYDDGVHGTHALDGGVLANQAIHYVDILLFFAHRRARTVCAFGGTRAHTMECEDAINLSLQFEDGLVGSLNANTFSLPENMEGSVTLWFERATIKIGGTALNRITYWHGPGEDGALRCGEDIGSVYGNGHERVVENLLSHLTHRTPLYTNLNEQLQVVSILDGAYRSMQTSQVITL